MTNARIASCFCIEGIGYIELFCGCSCWSHTPDDRVVHDGGIHGDEYPSPCGLVKYLLRCVDRCKESCCLYRVECNIDLWIVRSCHMKHVSTCYFNMNYYVVTNCHLIVCGMFPINYCNKDWMGDEANTCTVNVRDNDSCQQGYYIVEMTRKYYF